MEIKLLSVPAVVGAALLVIAGEYGNGEERVERLREDGFDYDTVQTCVNELLPIIKEYS